MTNGIITYNLGEGITAFTTDRTVGRDPHLVRAAVCACVNAADGGEVCSEEMLRFARPHQTHEDRIMPVAEEFFSLPDRIREMLMEGKDAVITDVPDTILGVSTADCIPVVLYDREHHAAAAIHAGWRGTVQRIVMKTIEQMKATYGTNPATCMAVVGPGISLDSFEVGDEVYDTFVKAGFIMTTVAQRYPAFTMENEEGQREKWHIDLKEINRQQLMTMGVPQENIVVSDVDTFTDTRFFSARREQKGGEKCGRIFTGFVIHANTL